MRLLLAFGFFVVLGQNQFNAITVTGNSQDDVVTRGCKNLEDTTPLLRLKRYLFCDYDNTIRPNQAKTVTNITLRLMPKFMEFVGDNGILTLHSWMSFSWTDTHLTWTPSDYDGVTYIHVRSYNLWVPDLCVYNSGDMSNDQFEMPDTECLLFNTGAVNCVPVIKYISKCHIDYTYWPHDQQKCRIAFGSWTYTGEEIDFHLDGNGVRMDNYENNSVWDFQFVDAVKLVKIYKCCPNDTFPRIDYTFLLTRHNDITHASYITPAITLILLTLTVLWLDSRSVERIAVASVNFICHLLCIFDLHWNLPYNGINTPHILVFYRYSSALATFALILTTLLRKLQDISKEMPNWISSTMIVVLNNKAGRFLVLNDEESKIAGGGLVSEENSDLPKSQVKRLSWRHFAVIIEWLSFFCVILIYVIILITLVPTGLIEEAVFRVCSFTFHWAYDYHQFSFHKFHPLNIQSSYIRSSFVVHSETMNNMCKNSFFPVLLFILDVVCVDVIATKDCNDVESKSTVLQLKRHLLCEYDSEVRPVQNNNNMTRVTFRLTPHFYDYRQETEIFVLHAWIGMAWSDSHLTWNPEQYDNIKWIPVLSYEIWTPDITQHNEWIDESPEHYGHSKCWVWRDGTVQYLSPAKFSTHCLPDYTWWPYDTLNCTIQFGSWSHIGDEIDLFFYQNMSLQASIESKHVEWDLLKVDTTKWEDRYKFNSGSIAKMLSYHFILRRHTGIIRIAYVSPTIVLMVLTLTVLWLEPKSFERMVTANLNFICHILCIQDVHWEMPKSGFNPPKLLTFYESSLAIATFTLILTSILRHLQELTTEPPVWISFITTSILRSRIGQILLVSILDPAATAKIEINADDNTDLVQSDSKKSPWRYVTVLIGWLAFLGVFLTYIILLSTYFPTDYAVNL
ncbi:uncharacterized protein [Linepithema humile]|uniref:uncharacterized protein n=1 Tax=Linepithema humile TaxID=83485 RepID=UPI00351EE4A9